MTASSRIRNIPLSQLVLSPANVRKTPATAAEDAELEASIRAKGILQNLIVHSVHDGLYEVDAGGRRLAILQKLAAEGVINADDKIPCKIEEPEDAAETSLAENTIRAAMHPADEFVAMAALIDAGATIEDVALRFGTSERRVRQRLRLGKLAPELLDAFRAGDIGLEAVTAFTLGADHAAQLAVWAQVREHSYISPHRIRHLLTESAIALDSDLGLFVGVEAYEAAGGTITRDLFSADDEGFMDDAALVRRLAIEKLEAKATELRADWAWTKAVLDLEYGALAQYARLCPQPAEVPAELAEEIEQIGQRLGELEEIDADAFTDELATEAERLEERRVEIDDLVESLAVYSDKTALAPALSSRSVIAANSVCTRVWSNALQPATRLIARPATATPVTTTKPGRRAMATTTATSNPQLRTSRPSRLCARSSVSARASLTISRRTATRSPARIWQEISRSRSIWRSMRCAPTCSTASAITQTRSICARSRRRPAAR